MPRPSLKEERTKMILIAIRYCVARYGLEGATQDRIADAAGMKRPMLRHYLGNREAMIETFIDHMANELNTETDWLIDALPDEERMSAMLDILFGPIGISDAETLLAFQAVAAATDRYPHARDVLLQAIKRFIDAIDQEIAKSHPTADAGHRKTTAHAIANLHFSVDGLSPLNPPTEWRDHARSAADILIRSLEK